MTPSLVISSILSLQWILGYLCHYATMLFEKITPTDPNLVEQETN